MPPASPTPAGPRRPLVITSDDGLLDDLLRLAALAGVEIEVAPDPIAARARYPRAPLVIIAADQAAACIRARLPRRTNVIMAGTAHGPSPWPLAADIGAAHVALLPEAEPWLVERFAQCLHLPAVGSGQTVAVLGGRGGAGASVLAVGLALAAAHARLRTLLVDADPLGGGLDLLLGWEGLDGLRWPELPAGGVAAPALVGALPVRGDLALLSWDRGEHVTVDQSVMAAALDAGRQARELIIVDISRHLQAPATQLALTRSDRVLLVVPAELRATAAAAQVVRRAAVHCANIELVVRGPAPGKLRAIEIADALGLPLAGTLRPEPGLAGALERGRAPGAHGAGPLAALCRRLLADLVGPAREVA